MNAVLVRVLLPGESRDGRVQTWAEIARDSDFGRKVDGYTNWSELVELRPGVDVMTLPSAAAGYVEPETTARLADALHTIADEPWSWWRDWPSERVAPRPMRFVRRWSTCSRERAVGAATGGR